MTSVVSKSNPISHYNWGNNAEAWTLLENSGLSIKQESMPSGAEESLHYHKQSQQFFYITKGRAVFEIDQIIFIVNEGEGIHIEPNQQHRIMNKDEKLLEFIICSQPSTRNDRYDLV